MRTNLLYIAISIIGFFVFFNFVIKNNADQLYCKRKIQVQIENFKTSVFRLGLIDISEEEKYIDNVKNNLYEQCLK